VTKLTPTTSRVHLRLMDDSDDPVVARLSVRLSNTLEPQMHVQQFPLLTRPLLVPPPAAAAGKKIKARLKPNTHRLEIHVPVDTRPEVWNQDRASSLGTAQVEDDRLKNQETATGKQRGEEPRLSEVRMQSEMIPPRGVYMLGIMHDGEFGPSLRASN
jgi:DNA-directed RNA polymerase-3 subunit RPC5